MALDFVATIYSGPNLTGISRILAGGDSHRSDGDDGPELMGAGLWHALQSNELSTSAFTDANVIVFKNDDYSGPFSQATLPKGGGVAYWNCAGEIGSVYAVATNRLGEKEIRQSARQQLEAQWISFLDQKLGGTPASREGGPAISWQAFPRDIEYLDPALVYLRITQALNISIEWWWDYAASMTYHLFPFIDNLGHVRVWGARWAIWVEDGAKQGKIEQQLASQVESGLGQLEAQVNAKLAALDGFGALREVYMLPGNQVGATGAIGTFNGDTNDDATIVVVL